MSLYYTDGNSPPPSSIFLKTLASMPNASKKRIYQDKKTIKIKSHKEFEPAILIQKHFNNVIQNNNIDNIQSCTLYRLTVLVHFKNLNTSCVQKILNSKRKIMRHVA